MKLAIIEDNRQLLENINILLSGEKDIEIVGTFSSAEEALCGIVEAGPEIILTDLGLPGMTGIELIRKIKEDLPDVDIMAFTVFEDRETVFAALKAGANGYVLKGCKPWELIEALHSLYSGGAPMSPIIARAVIKEFQEDLPDDHYLLTPREKEIIKCIEKGFSYKEIGKTFNISPHTVHTHIKKIYEKLYAKTRQEALSKARRKGII